MGRGKIYTIDYGTYGKCNLCDYEVRNNKRALKLHFKYSHPEEFFENNREDRIRCHICKKPNCMMH